MDPAHDQQLRQALALATVARGRLEMFAQKAGVEGRPSAAALFNALAASAGVQAHRFTMLLRGKVHDTAANLAEAVNELLPGLLQGYAELVAQADEAGFGVAGSALDQTTQALVRQNELARALEEGDDSGEAYLLCPVCGWLARGQAPDNCPVCGCIAAKFQALGLPD
jgi:rubrerythrin